MTANLKGFQRAMTRPMVDDDNKLLGYIKWRYALKTDTDVANFLLTSPSEVSRIRRGDKGLSYRMLIIMYDKTDLSIEQIRELYKERKL